MPVEGFISNSFVGIIFPTSCVDYLSNLTIIVSFVIFSGGYHEHLVTFRWLTQILTDLLWKYRQPRKPPWTHYLEMKEESLKRHGNEDMLNVWLYRFQTKRISTPWTGIINHVVSYSRSVWDGLRCRKRHLLTRTESHKKALTRPRVKWRKASESAYPTNVLESIVLLMSLLNVILNYMFAPGQKVEDPGVDTCPENTKRNISSSLHYAAHRFIYSTLSYTIHGDMANSKVLFSGLKFGKCSSVVEARLWETRNVKGGGELMGVICSSLTLRKKSSYLYDMDSDDEQCLVRIHERSYAENSVSYEITEDMFEKASHNQEADQGNATNQASSVKTYIARCYLDRRPVMIMEMHVNISGPTKVDVGGNDS
ncbi:hypothetical protein DY000_02041610 [Brassica cretica]|uniref:Uncharacterized protein n=1 Tax=Brassica cretica TaxID=69181 RepID=A0ABQ7BHA6_BRACR|nr:hypothetical protein DY000_02041610 [Brassica cretica]